MHETWTSLRAMLAALERHHGDDPEYAGQIADIRGRLRAAKMDDYITQGVAAWPPLSLEQRARLAVLLLQPDTGAAA